ncbi:MAG TPA: 50S ribosomal protein L17 [Bacteroidota bacterium]|jgi:large subunit ribosomal protein L17|nr:50S ribosomal protein L17 [Bacteroidota bacterium]
MRHRKSGRKLKRTASHRKATLIALSTALLRHKRIRTTVAKAKETRMFVEKLITRAKNAVAGETEQQKNVHARREISRYIKDRAVVTELFGEIAPKVANRAGGYTRVVKLGQRHGDNAEVALLELVDFQIVQEKKKAKADKPKKKKEKEVNAPQADTKI